MVECLLDVYLSLPFLSASSGSGRPTPPSSGSDQLFMTLAMFLSLGLVFYVLIWRPESRKRKEREETLNALKNKDKVVTIGGMFGTVTHVDKEEVTLIVDQKKDIRLKFRRSAIERIESSGKEEQKKK